MRHNKIQRRFRLLCKRNAIDSRYEDNAPATTAIGHRHCHVGVLNN